MTQKTKLKRDEFKIRIAGVGLGTHKYSITCDKLFFELNEISELIDGTIHLQIEMENCENMVIFHFNFKGKVIALCDRCLDPLSLNLKFSEQLIVKLVENSEMYENEDNLWYIDENSYEIDIFHFIYESVRLALPLRMVHPDDKNGVSTCNSDILKRIDELSSKTDKIDPRWEALQHIKDKIN